MENIDFKSLHVDKENQLVSYNDELHKYWTKDKLMPCISATTLIGQYTTFDEFFWSRYKALEVVMSAEDFKQFKPTLLEKKVYTDDILTDWNIDPEVFEQALQDILDEWEEKRETACQRGTDIHLRYEMQTLEQDYTGIEKFGVKPFTGYNINTTNIISEGQHVLPELLISFIAPSGQFALAGQADLVVVDGWDVTILDYKTNKELKTRSYYDRRKRKSEKMKYPLNHLDDVNFWHYTMQLSLYAWMIEQVDSRFNIKNLVLLHHDHDDNKQLYELQYLKKSVERMISHYKQQLDYSQYKERNTPKHELI